MPVRVKLFAIGFLGLALSLPAFAQAAAETANTTQAAAKTQPTVPAPAMPEGQARQAPGDQPQQATPEPAQQTQLPETTASAPLRVMVGKSILINTTVPLKRVSVTDPAIADALVVTPTQILVHGRAPGEVSLIVWDEQERSRSFDLRVDVDVTAATEEIHRIFPEEKIDVSASRSAIVLSGHVATKEDSERVGLIAGAFSKNVVNVLTYGPVGAQEVLLEVKFAEVDRSAITQLGMNLFSTGAANTFGATSTGQFGPFAGSKVGSVTSDVNLNGTPPGNNSATGEIGNTNSHQPGSFGMNDLLNIFLFRTDINLGATIKALQQKNILQILAEPNLIAVNGKESSFLAGGEFPIPVVQGAGALGSVTIQFKEFGVRLKFLPVIMPNGNIYLHVTPEVSSLDFANGLQISGFTVPALTTRRADTEFELKDGQSFVIAGLMDNRLTNLTSKVPGLGDIPILGTFFKSKNLNKSKTELMVLVTAHKVSPTMQPPPLPPFPQKFMEEGKPGAAKTTPGSAKPAAGGK
jgi:pilus assembly protein CpaC